MTAASTSTSTSPQISRFAHSTRLAISGLGPPAEAHASHHIRAVVALVWPYSSSTRALSLLLAEPDIRLRKGKGQVKVTFHGPSAEAVAKGQVGIGDIVKLGLEGAQWIQSSENVSTPGKKIEWDLVFDGKANLDVKRDSRVLASINVDQPVQVPTTTASPPAQLVEPSLNGDGPTSYLRNSDAWSSPAFVKGKRQSSGLFFDASLDPFADDDGFVVGKGRKRTKFARHSDSWRLLDRTPSPKEDNAGLLLDNLEGSAEAAASANPPQTVSNAHDVEILHEHSVERVQLESTPASAPDASVGTRPPSHLAESSLRDIGPETLVATQSLDASQHEAGQMQPPERPLGIDPQSVAISEGLLAPGLPPALSFELEQLPLALPIESEFSLAPQSEVNVRDARLESSPPIPGGFSPIDQSIQPVSWPSSYEEAPQPRLDPSEDSQPSIDGRGSEFEFLNTSPVEPYSSAEHTWPHLGSSADIQVTLPVPSNSGVPASADASVSPSEFHHESTQKISPYDGQTLSTPREVARSDSAVRDVRGAAQDENVNANSERAPDSSSQMLVDPSLVKNLETDPDLVANSGEYSEVAREVSDQVHDSRTWSEKLDVSAVDAESERVYSPPPFPFQQHWHRRTSGQRSRRSSNYASIDGASDEDSTDESSDVEDMLHSSHRLETFDREQQRYKGVGTDGAIRASTPALSPLLDETNRAQSAQVRGKDELISTLHALDGSRSVAVLETPDDDAISGDPLTKSVDEAVPGTVLSPKERTPDLEAREVDDAGKEKRMDFSELQELAAGRIESSAIPPDSACGDPSSPAVDATTEKEGYQDEPLPPSRQGPVGESSNPLEEPTAPLQLPGEVHNQKISYQLVTPENTQQESGDLQLQDEIGEPEREISLPPTPLNTQEDADVPQPTVEIPIQSAAKIGESKTPATPMPTSVDEVRERRRSPRLSRKFPPSQGVNVVVSPYFTPRRTTQRRPQDQLATPDKVTFVTQNQPPVDGATQTTEKENKLTDHSLTNQEIAPKPQLTTELKAGLTTPLSCYTLLSLLQDHFAQSVDVLALSTTASAEPLKAKSGPRDWHTTLHLTEPSLHGNKTITAQIFRPYKTALPRVQRGHVVLLRNFKVQSQKRKCSLLSTESSAWAVFAVPRKSGHDMTSNDAVVVGPPIEYGLKETTYAAELKGWWESEGEGQHPAHNRGGQTAETMPAAENGVAEVTHVLGDGTVYQDNTEGDEQIGAPRELRSGRRYAEPENPQKHADKLEQQDEGIEGEGFVHELRDGTVYQDNTEGKTEGNEQVDAPRELRSGKRYADPEPAQKEADELQQQDEEIKDESLVHELRDGTVYQDDTEAKTEGNDQVDAPRELRSGRRYAGPEPAQEQADEPQQQDEEVEDESLVHELRDGLTYTDD